MAAEKIDALELNIQSKLSVENLDKLIASLNKLGKACKNTNGKKAADNIKKVGDSSKQAAGGVEQFLGKAVRITAVIALFKKAGDVIGDSVAKALTYNKTLNMFTVSLGEYANNATKYGETVRNAFGIDIAEWQKAQGVFQTLVTGFGVGGDQAAYMSQNLTQLSFDLASFWDITNEEAQNKLKAAISGRLEPIRKLGWDLSQSKLVDIAKNPKYYGQQTYSINEQTGAIEANTVAVDDNTRHKIVNFNQLTQQEKVQLRYIALMTQVTQVQNNYAKTLNDPNNQLKIFKAQLEMTSRELGNVFIPALNQVLPYLTAFAQLAGEAFRAIAKFFGYEIPDMSDRMDISSVAEPYNDVVEATGRAAGNAKKLKDYMLGIDELNVLKKPDDTLGGGGGRVGENSNLSNLLTPGYDFLSGAIKSRVEDVKEDIKLFTNQLQKDLKANPLKLFWEIVGTGAGELGSSIWELLIGKTPDEIGVEFIKTGQDVGYLFVKNLLQKPGEDLIRLILGKTSDDVKSEAAKLGQDVGKRFFAEFTLAGLKALNSIGFKPLYEAASGRNLNTDIERIERQLKNLEVNDKAHSSGGGSHNFDRSKYVKDFGNTSANEAYKQSETYKKTQELLKKGLATGYGSATTSNAAARMVIKAPEVSFGNTSADEAKKRGEEVIKAYADGIASGGSTAQNAANGVFNKAVNGVDNNGKGGQMFNNTAANEAYKYAMGLTSAKAKAEANLGGKSLAAQGTNGAKSLADDSRVGFNYAGRMSGQGYIGGLEKYKSKASSSGRIIAEAALNTLKKVLGIHSPSTAYGEQAYWSVMGYAKNMERYSYLAENAAKDMANSALKAVETANSTIGGGASVPTTTNAGYGVGMANQGAMMNLASNIYQAVVSGMATAGGNNGDIVLTCDGKEFFRIVRNEQRKSGIAIGNGAFA